MNARLQTIVTNSIALLTVALLGCGGAGMPTADAGPRDRVATAPACPASQTRCGTTCVNTQTDKNNCGRCGNRCAMGQVCTAGACVMPMADAPCRVPMGQPAQTRCGGRCTNVQSDSANCGMCGRACPAGQQCRMGMCVMPTPPTTCAAPRMVCGTACVAVQTDRNNCGACGTRCTGTQICQMGRCQEPPCPMGQTRCGTACVTTRTDRNHCGACGMRCTGEQVCVMGRCTAPPPPEVTCPAGLTQCGMGAATRCVDTSSSLTHCGRCNNPVGPTQICLDGRAVCSEGDGFEECGGTCVNINRDNENCGGCGITCDAGEGCEAGVCVVRACDPGEEDEVTSCDSDFDCCGEMLCEDNRCACRAAGESCGNSFDCCGAGVCIDGTCSAGACLGYNRVCENNDQCCGDLLCFEDESGDGFPRCR